MKRTTYQVPELRDENDNIIQQGAFGKNTALANSTNDGWIDYVANDLEALYNNTMGGTGGEINTETITGKTGTITNLTATTVKAGTLTADALNGPLTGNVTGDLNGNVTGNLTGNVTGTADKAVADGSGNNIVNTYVTKSGLASSVSTTSLTVSGETSVPTANEGNSSKAIANTEYVQGELTNYLPLSGGTMTGDTLITMGNGESFVRNWNNGLYLGGTNENNASTLVLFTNSSANGFQLEAGDGTTFKRMDGKPDGTLTWDGNNILTAANYNSYALPLSGGTLTGVVNGVTPPVGDNSTKIATTEFVNAKAENYLPLSGGTLTGDVFGVTPPNGDNSKKIANTEFIQALASILVPVGCVQAFAGSTTPQGWLLCDGSAVSRTDYAALYAVIGTTYGAGNGSSTFNLPNLIDRFIQGNATAGTEKSAGLPNITGSFYAYSYADGTPTGCMTSFYPTGNAFNLDNHASSSTKYETFYINASRSSSIYGNSTTVQPPALTMRYIIKY